MGVQLDKQIPSFMLVLRALANGTDTDVYVEKEMRLQYLFHETGITYSHLVSMVKLIEEKGWIKCGKDGRDIIVVVTDEGKKVTEAIVRLFEALKIDYKKVKRR